MKKFLVIGFAVLALSVIGALSLESEQVAVELPEHNQPDTVSVATDTIASAAVVVPFATATLPSATATSSIKLLPGNEVAQGGTLRVVLEDYPEKPELKFGKTTYNLFEYGGDWNALIPISADALTGQANITIGSSTETVMIQPGNFEIVTIDLPDIITTPQKAAKYRTEKKEIVAAYGASAPNVEFSKPFGYPLDDMTVTNPFGVTYFDPSDGYRTFHNGIDLKAAVGTPVKAVNDGTVKIADTYLLEGSFVLLDHGFGIFSDYLHLSELDVKVGDRVEKGQIIGLAGESGESVGPHLHLIVKINGVPVDPLAFIGLWKNE